MKALRITAEQAQKVVPQRITCVDVHHSVDPMLIATGDKRGCIGESSLIMLVLWRRRRHFRLDFVLISML